jgi:cardiolipin synthase C
MASIAARHSRIFSLPFPNSGRAAERHVWHKAFQTCAAVLLGAVLAGCGSLPPNTGRQPSTALPFSPDTLLGRTVRQSMPLTALAKSDSGFRLLPDASEAYEHRIALIDAARQSLDLQYYSIHYDNSTEALLRHLQAAARRGVRVRILVDDFNTAGNNAKVLLLDREPNVQIRVFNPLLGPRGSQAGRIVGSLLDFKRIQRRMHNKLLVADNAFAITGGRNLGDEYFGQGEKSNFLDLDVLVAGRVVRELSQSFDRYWADDLAYPAARLTGGQHPADEPAAPAAEGDGAAPVGTPAGGLAEDIAQGKVGLVWAPSALLADRPSKIQAEDVDDEEETAVGGLLDVLARARSDLVIVSPYFVPGGRIMASLRDLRARGVRIRVLTNSLASNDAPLAHVGYARYRKEMLRMGIELYELRAAGDIHRRVLGSTPTARDSLHSKVLEQDGRVVVVGSMNLDLRSELQNTEMGLVIQSRVLARSVAQQFESLLRRCYRVALSGDELRWEPPEGGAPLESDPDASAALRAILHIVAPLAPDEML